MRSHRSICLLPPAYPSITASSNGSITSNSALTHPAADLTPKGAAPAAEPGLLQGQLHADHRRHHARARHHGGRLHLAGVPARHPLWFAPMPPPHLSPPSGPPHPITPAGAIPYHENSRVWSHNDPSAPSIEKMPRRHDHIRGKCEAHAVPG